MNTRSIQAGVTGILLLFLTLFAADHSLAQTDPGILVKKIEVQYVGPATVSQELIRANMKTSVGQAYSDQSVQEDIRNLYKTNDIENVRIYSEALGDGVKVVVVVQTRSNVDEVVLQGVAQVKARRLRKEIDTSPGDTLSEETIDSDRQKIIEYYQKKGYGDVGVEYKVDANEQTGSARVTFIVSEGGKSVIKDVRFEGNVAFEDKELRKQMKTKGKNMLSFINKSGRLKDEQMDTDILAIEQFYQDNGYIDAQVINVTKVPVSKNKIDLLVAVSEGPQYNVGTFRISGNELYTSDEIRAVLGMTEGSIYSPSGLRRDTQRIQDIYGSKGYVDLYVLPETTPGGAGVVNLTYAIDEGYESYVERINVEGNTKTKDKVIRRELAVYPGDIYDTTKVESSRLRLQNTGYFGRVEAFPGETLIPGRKDLNVVVEEKRTGSFNFGAGFSSIDSLIGFVEVQQGNFDLFKWPNFTGAGQKFRMRAQYGSERSDFILSLTEPWFMGKKLSLGGDAFYREATFVSDDYDQRNIGADIHIRKPIGRFTSVRLQYTLESIEIYDIDSDASPEIQSQEGKNMKSALDALVVYDTRDSVFLTRKGHRLEFSPWVSGGFLGGDQDTYGFAIEGSKYWSLPWDTIFLVNAEVAVVDNWSDGEMVPIYDRLYLGGANNLRGFDFRDVGPKDINGEPIGGGTLARLTVEYTFPLITKVRGAVFYDTGFVNEDAYDWSTGEVNSDVGIGLRMDLPIGPVRLDFGYPVQSDEVNDSGGKFNFNIGYQF